ncbi:MAG: hypothetical protein JXR83_01190 [Deltaproteobacteria bacterium]|nr:hypothetical protein [Deltaproteobacteria bacterium]
MISPDKPQKDNLAPLDREQRAGDVRTGLVDIVLRQIGLKFIAAVIAMLALATAIYFVVETRQNDQLRKTLLDTQEQLRVSTGPDLETLEDKVARLVKAEAGLYTGDLRDPSFTIAHLASKKGLYLRIPIDEARDRATLESAARKQHSDAVNGCLGTTATLYGKLLNDGAMLKPDFRQQIEEASTRQRLRAIEEDIAIRAGRDLMSLAKNIRADYLLVVLEEPGTEHAQKRAILWDLGRNRMLARARTKGTGKPQPVQWVDPSHYHAHRPNIDITAQNTADDCAIAAAIRGD